MSKEKSKNPIRTNINIDEPRYDQSGYIGRLKHFTLLTNPMNILASCSALENAKSVVQRYKKKEKLYITEEELWKNKYLFDSAYHPDTGELMVLPGRMSFQVPGNTVMITMMLAFSKTLVGLIVTQWINQSFNALVNFTNRSGNSELTDEEIMENYAAATGGAVTACVILKALTKSLPPIAGRLIPFVAVAVVNGINVPMMRRKELEKGISVTDDKRKQLGTSVNAATKAIVETVTCRTAMAVPPLVMTPFIMNHLDKINFFCRYPWAELPICAATVGILVAIGTPMGLALIAQQSKIDIEDIEPDEREKLKKKKAPKTLWYNKGL